MSRPFGLGGFVCYSAIFLSSDCSSCSFRMWRILNFVSPSSLIDPN